MVAVSSWHSTAAAAVRRSIVTALVLTGGYTTSFSVALLAAGDPATNAGALAYISAGTGMLLVLLASFLVAGGRVRLLQAAAAGGGSFVRLGAMAVAGAVVGLASLAPQLPELLAAAGEQGGAEAPVAGMAAYLLGLLAGFGLLCAAGSSVGAAAGRRWPEAWTLLERAQGYLLLLAGLGTAYYAFFAVRSAEGHEVEDRLIDAAHGVHGLLTDVLHAVPAWLVPTAYLALIGWLLLRRRRTGPQDPDSGHERAATPAPAVAPAAPPAQAPAPAAQPAPAVSRAGSRRRPPPQQDGGVAPGPRERSAGVPDAAEHRPRHYNPKALRRARIPASRPGRFNGRRLLRAVKPRR
jgi:cytochrome c biogenesis protein CcdA